MDLNHLQLPSSMLADLYKNSLVESYSEKLKAKKEPVAANSIASKKSLHYLGKNQKKVCLLVTYAKDVYLPDEQLNFLTAILQACRLNLGDVAIVNHYREKTSFQEIREQLNSHYLIIFGDDFPNISLQEIPLFSVVTINDCKILYSPAAEQLNKADQESKLLKGKLWSCLKQMFNV